MAMTSWQRQHGTWQHANMAAFQHSNMATAPWRQSNDMMAMKTWHGQYDKCNIAMTTWQWTHGNGNMTRCNMAMATWQLQQVNDNMALEQWQ